MQRATSSDGTVSHGDVSDSGCDILLGVCCNKFLIAVLLLVSPVSTAADLFIIMNGNEVGC